MDKLGDFPVSHPGMVRKLSQSRDGKWDLLVELPELSAHSQTSADTPRPLPAVCSPGESTLLTLSWEHTSLEVTATLGKWLIQRNAVLRTTVHSQARPQRSSFLNTKSLIPMVLHAGKFLRETLTHPLISWSLLPLPSGSSCPYPNFL